MAPRTSEFANDGRGALLHTQSLRDALARYPALLTQTSDPDEIVELLGGAFEVEDEYSIQGGHSVTVLRGRNRRHAVLTKSAGHWDPARVYEATLRVVEGGSR